MSRQRAKSRFLPRAWRQLFRWRGACWLLMSLGSLTLTASTAIALTAADVRRIADTAPAVSVVPAPSPADGEVKASIDIPAPPSEVWRVLFDCARAPAIMPSLTSCSVLETGPGGRWDVREHRVRWISLLPEIASRFRSDYVQDQSIQFQLVSGDLSALDGEWRLAPIFYGAATRLSYNARVGFGALIPSFVIRNSLEADIPQFLQAIRTEAMRGAGVRIATP
jgi:uncharacterized membrane protein